MGDVQAHAARLVALFVGSILYGILLTTFVPCIQSLLFSASQRFQLKPRSQIKVPIVAATILMFLVSTFSAILSLQDVFDAFIDYDGPGGALQFYHTGNHGWKHWMLAVEDAVQVILGDGLLIYRCYVIYDRSWRAIAVPAVSWMALAAMAITSAYRESVLDAGKTLDDSSMMPFLSTTLILTFATSIITTSLIVRRLIMLESPQNVRPYLLSRIAKIFFETGLVYTLSIIASLGIYLTNSNLEYVASLGVIHIIPITCNLLLIRVEGVNRSEPHGAGSRSSGESKFNSKGEYEV